MLLFTSVMDVSVDVLVDLGRPALEGAILREPWEAKPLFVNREKRWLSIASAFASAEAVKTESDGRVAP